MIGTTAVDLEPRLTAAARSNEGNEHKSGDVASNCSNALPSSQQLEQLEQLEKVKQDANAAFSFQLTEIKQHHQTQLKKEKEETQQKIKQLEQMLVNSGKGSDLKIFKQQQIKYTDMVRRYEQQKLTQLQLWKEEQNDKMDEKQRHLKNLADKHNNQTKRLKESMQKKHSLDLKHTLEEHTKNFQKLMETNLIQKQNLKKVTTKIKYYLK